MPRSMSSKGATGSWTPKPDIGHSSWEARSASWSANTPLSARLQVPHPGITSTRWKGKKAIDYFVQRQAQVGDMRLLQSGVSDHMGCKAEWKPDLTHQKNKTVMKKSKTFSKPSWEIERMEEDPGKELGCPRSRRVEDGGAGELH